MTSRSPTFDTELKFGCPTDLRQRFSALCKSLGLNQSHVMRLLVEEFIASIKQKDREGIT